jgi:hypothetical protein
MARAKVAAILPIIGRLYELLEHDDCIRVTSTGQQII